MEGKEGGLDERLGEEAERGRLSVGWLCTLERESGCCVSGCDVIAVSPKG